jgi:hypothetical protein
VSEGGFDTLEYLNATGTDHPAEQPGGASRSGTVNDEGVTILEGRLGVLSPVRCQLLDLTRRRRQVHSTQVQDRDAVGHVCEGRILKSDTGQVHDVPSTVKPHEAEPGLGVVCG